jgi:protein TonB
MAGDSSTFGHYGATEPMPRSWFAAIIPSSMLWAAAIGVAMLGVGAKQVIEKHTDIKFTEFVKPPPPPPPPPPPEPKPEPPKPKPPPAAAPVVPKDMKVRILEKPPPPKELVAPQEMPQEKPPEEDANKDKGIAVFGTPGEGDPAGLEGGMQGGKAGGMKGVIELPDGAVPPKARSSNKPPEYPQEMRKEGRVGYVTLRIIIDANGDVTDVQTVDGDEPFVTAAINAVKHWRYQPATMNGVPIAVYRNIKVKFKLDI